jgi:3-deoxy-D-manno-octulosonic acid kinase
MMQASPNEKVVITQVENRWICSAWPDAALAWFDPAVPQWQAQPIGGAGRGSAWYMNLQGHPVVLRQYRRGGMVARISRDLYVWRGVQASRSFREFAVLAALTARGLRVARPVAALVERTCGLFYRAALITQRIDRARPLWAFEQPAVWQQAGLAIARMHREGVWHADLNVNNIQIDGQGQVWLIDFDRAQMDVHAPERLRANLLRLERSVLKVCPSVYAAAWPVLLHGYDQGMIGDHCAT